MDSLLLCSFAHASDINVITDYIFQNYELERNCIFVFENEDDQDEIFCTYNVVGSNHFIENTIMIHRKKESNTLYTINALNEIIKRTNNGILDKKFIIEWFRYNNSLLLTVNQSVRIIPLLLKTITRK